MRAADHANRLPLPLPARHGVAIGASPIWRTATTVARRCGPKGGIMEERRLLAAIEAALEALADGDVRLAEAILLAAAEEGDVNPNVQQRPWNGWPGERSPWR
jgi:hypothetical protein